MWVPALNGVSSSLLFFVAFPISVSSNMEDDRMSITRATGSSAVIPCDLPTQNIQYIHWYKFQEGTVPRRLLYYDVSSSKVVLGPGISPGKYHGYEGTDKMYKFVISNLQESDSGVYRCAVWEKYSGSAFLYTALKFYLDIDMSPKPTMFLPSITEIKRDNTGTYLCLLENFFPHVIKVYWREKGGNRVLPSQQGNTMKTADTYMKFSWLTVSGNSMDKQHMCIVKHEKNKKATNQEILFPSVNEGMPEGSMNEHTQVNYCPFHNYSKVLRTRQLIKGLLLDTLQLQLMNTSAYYTYLLLLFKSTVYFVIITSCVFRRTGVCSNQKSS
uniref:Ig-like domain-containing protein n=1 Tax=Moschus moschiferus TaxID=68415 RepID=A0A8C6D6K0_MOSMO